MIDITFNHGSEVVLVKVQGNTVLFGSTIYGARLADIEGLRLEYAGTIREFPDLKDDIDWRVKAIERFKDHIRVLKEEDKIADYVIYELSSKGYLPKLKQKAGFRPVRIG